MLKRYTRQVSEHGVQRPGYLLTGCVKSSSNTSRGACGGSLPTMPGGALSSPSYKKMWTALREAHAWRTNEAIRVTNLLHRFLHIVHVCVR